MDHYDDDYDESRRSRWLRIGGGVLAGVVLLAAGFGIGRLSVPASGSGQQQHATVTAQGGSGPTRVENGVPVGYAHTQDGAVAAATNFVMVYDGPLNTDPVKYRAAIGTLSAPRSKARFQAEAERSLATFQSATGLISYAQQGRAEVFRTVPLAFHLDTYSDGTAQVSIWSESFIAIDGVVPAKETWTTATYIVEWATGDWKLSSIGAYKGGSEGPVPVTTQPSLPTAALPAQLKEFKTYREAVPS